MQEFIFLFNNTADLFSSTFSVPLKCTEHSYFFSKVIDSAFITMKML